MTEDEVSVCPDCDSSKIRVVSAGSVQTSERPPGRYRCRGCDARFDSPSTRPPQSTSVAQGLAGKLADPEVETLADLTEKYGDPA